MSALPTTPARAERSSCCGASASKAAAPPATASAGACCGDPTPNAETGACCSAPSATCGCRQGAEQERGGTAGATGGRLPVAVIGAGPVGLAAAVQLVAKGEMPLVLEAGDVVGASIREWAHVRLFSPWKYVVDPTARQTLEASGWTMPDEDALPTGGELLERLVQPDGRRRRGRRG